MTTQTVEKSAVRQMLSGTVPLFFATSGISAFLLFLVQPLVGKTLLPLYGGSASVWTTCLLFFQTVLLAGYGYAHALTRLFPPKKQIWIHGIVLVIAVLLSRILPGGQPEVSHQFPVVMLLLTLLKHVGLPFFALSATAPLLQHWYHLRFPARSPYPLYAVSNAGSFAAVLAYPFLVERFFSLNTQELLWSIGFGVFAVACMASGWMTRRASLQNGHGGVKVSSNAPRPPISTGEVDVHPLKAEIPFADAIPTNPRFLWFGFSAAGSMLLLTTTEQISQDVAATPLFWMIPLCLYLLSYVICFSSDNVYRRKYWIPALCAATAVVAVQIFWGNELPIALQLSLYVVTLFIGCMVAHGELAHQKPVASHLTRFYLWTSFGGIAGGLLVAIVAPLLFPDLWEYSLLWPALLLLVWLTVTRESTSFASEIDNRKIKLILAAGIAVSGIGFVVNVVHDNLSTVYASRNFYGRLTISETRHTRCLYHGRTLHGCQPKHAETLQPAFYYAPSSGMGITQQIYRELHSGPVRTGVVGLGAGICSVWNQTDDTMIFYEIDPDVIEVAQTEFDYLKRAKGVVRIVTGDARLTLAKANRTRQPPLDILVMDAFSSDAIPLHLITSEAIDIYRNRLRPNGVLVVHISNRHVNLEPLMLGIAEQMNAKPFVVYTSEDYANYILDTTWVVITDSPPFIEKLQKSNAWYPWPEEFATPLIFTDQYSNILDLL